MTEPRPEPRVVVCADTEGYSKRTSDSQLAARRQLRESLHTACERIGFGFDSIPAQDSGDGTMALAPRDVGLETMVVDFVRELRMELRRRNRRLIPEERVRLRLALHFGHVRIDGTGYAGRAPIVAARLIDLPEARQALRDAPDTDLVLIVSDFVYQEVVVDRLRGLDPDDFVRIEAKTEKYEGVCWLLRPETTGQPPRSFPTTAVPFPGFPGLSDPPGPASAGSPPADPAESPSGPAGTTGTKQPSQPPSPLPLSSGGSRLSIGNLGITTQGDGTTLHIYDDNSRKGSRT